MKKSAMLHAACSILQCGRKVSVENCNLMARNVRFGYNVHCSIASNADDGDDDDDNGCKVDTFTTVPTDICIEVDLSHIPLAK